MPIISTTTNTHTSIHSPSTRRKMLGSEFSTSLREEIFLERR